MVAHLTQLHKDIHDRKEVRISQGVLCLVAVDVLIVEEPLTTAEVALHDVLDFLWELLLYVSLESSQEERPQD